MMKQTLRGIGIGIFLAGAIWTLSEQFFPSNEKEQVALLQQQLTDSENKVKHLQETTNTETPANEAPKEDAVENSETAAPDSKENDDQQAAVEEQPEEAPQQQENDTVVTGTILVYENVSLYDIGKQAEDAGIIENGRELELFLYKPEYSRSIQIGQFELSSNMTLEEMAKILTGKQ